MENSLSLQFWNFNLAIIEFAFVYFFLTKQKNDLHRALQNRYQNENISVSSAHL